MKHIGNSEARVPATNNQTNFHNDLIHT